MRTRLPWRIRPEQAALLVRDDDRPFALIGRWAGGGALIGSQPVRISSPDHDPFAALEDVPLVARGRDAGAGQAVGGGWFGYLGYRLAGRVEAVDASPPDERRLPDFELAFYDHLLHLDDAERWWFEALWTPSRSVAIRDRLLGLSRRAARHGEEVGLGETVSARAFSTTAWTASPGPGGHALGVAACRERIHQGDLFQANLSRRFAARMTGAPVDLFATAVPRLRPDRAAWLEGPWGAVASLSPELFLDRHGDRVRSAPIKGTAAQPSEAGESRASAAALGGSAKDRAENVMIVDLVRNDLGRVCRPGSIRVTALAEPRPHAGVWHLVSEVVGRVREDVGDGELVRAAFPPGSVTGAPKVAALEVIAELETVAREVYTGAIGFVSPLAGLELSVAIRTFEFSGDQVWLGVGGAVVADSEPVDEVAECLTKVRPLLAAIGGRLDPQAAAVGGPPDPGDATIRPDEAGGLRAPLPARLAARPVPRPDPRAGVFETMLVDRGRPVAVDLHVARLADSVAALYGRRLPEDVVARVEAAGAAEPDGRARLRLEARPVGLRAGGGLDREVGRGVCRGVDVSIVVSRLAGPRPPVVLRRTTVPGGLGAHKWIDRRLLERLEESVSPAQPVVCDLDGRLLEAARSNLFVVVADGRVVTPPVGGRLLPGVTRGLILQAAGALGLGVVLADLTVEAVWSASEVFVSGSLGGLEGVESVDGAPVAGTGSVAAALAAVLDDGRLVAS